MIRARGAAVAAATLVLACVAAPAAALAWGLQGHTMIGQAAMAHLPPSLPAFVRSDAARQEIIYLQDEEDRLKAGEQDEYAWSREWTTDHYIDIGDDGKIAGIVPLNALPETRDDFEKALFRANPSVDPYDVGFLPYAILEGYEQVRTDFALWRAADAKSDTSDDTLEREGLVIHDIGIVSHFIGDGSQPLHVTVHYNGWGDFPNPQGFTESRDTHAEFESDFVDKFLTLADVQPLVGSAQVLSAIPMPEIEQYLAATDADVVPLYQIEKAGGFSLTDSTSAEHQKAVAFTAARLAAGSTMLDSLILTAWQTSASMKPD
jgi:hypothetical protein